MTNQFPINIFTFLCIFTAPSTAPHNFRSIIITATSITFQWDALTISESNGIVRGFTVACANRDSGSVTVSYLQIIITRYKKKF